LLVILAGPLSAQDLVIPGTFGTEACTEGGLSEIRPAALPGLSRPTSTSSFTFTVPQITIDNINNWRGGGTATFVLVAISVKKNPNGAAMQESRFNVRSSTPISSQSLTFSSLEKNTRYVIDLYRVSAPNTPLIRRCFKTRGEYTNAEQNLNPDGIRPDKDGRFGCCINPSAQLFRYALYPVL